MFGKLHRRQLWATLLANLTTFAFGIALGWTSPNIPRLQTENTPLASKQVLNLEEVSWVGSVFLIGGTVSTVLFGWMTEKFGRKATIIVAAVPQVASWAIIRFGTNVTHLVVARLLVGFAGGACFVTIPMYVAEISSDKIRGALGAFVIVSCNLGLVVGYAVNSYLDYYTVPYIAFAILAVFFAGFPSVGAESPKYLIMKNNLEAAERSLKYFRGVSQTEQKLPKPLQEELQALKNLVSTSSDKPKLTLADFTCKSAKKAIFIAIFLNFLTIANGIEVIINYGEIVFLDAGSTLPPEVSTIIVGLILLVGSYISSILSDKAGRRILMGVSSTGCGLSLSILSGYSYLKANGYHNPSLEWIPLACLSAYVLLGAFGILSLHLLIMSEVLSQKIRGIIFTVCLVGNWFLAFISVKFFPIMLAMIGMQGCMLAFALVCFSGTLFVLFVLPETKGKPIETIVNEMEK